MTHQVYKDLLAVMQKRRGPYAGADIPEFFAMAEALFTPDEAEVNNALPRKPVTAAAAAEAAGRSEEDVAAILEAMADKGLCKTFQREGVRYYQGQPFMPGCQGTDRRAQGGCETVRRGRPALQRSGRKISTSGHRFFICSPMWLTALTPSWMAVNIRFGCLRS